MQIVLTIPRNNILLSPRKTDHRKKISPTMKETPNGKSPRRARVSVLSPENTVGSSLVRGIQHFQTVVNMLFFQKYYVVY